MTGNVAAAINCETRRLLSPAVTAELAARLPLPLQKKALMSRSFIWKSTKTPTKPSVWLSKQKADVSLLQEMFCRKAIEQTIKEFGKIDILVNNAAEQHPQDSIEKITEKQLERTFRTNIFSYFFMVKAAMKHLKKGAAIINTTSVTAYKGSAHLLDYSSTKGAITAFTRSLSQALAHKKISVNGVAPGPIWTPLIPSTFPAEKVEKFGSDVPLGRPGQPEEVAPSFVFLASDDSSYMTGQILHPNGGTIVNG